MDVLRADTKGININIQDIPNYWACKQGSILKEQHITDINVSFQLALANNG
jgi:hypothetical protein